MSTLVSTETMTPLLSVIIPVYNEERRLPGSLAALQAFLSERSELAEVIVVDDGSTDRTVAIAQAMIPAVTTICRPHRGKGSAVRAGVLASRGRFVLITDADLATPLVELDRLMAALDGVEGVAIASRALKDSVVQEDPLHRRLMGRVFNAVVQTLVLPGLQDTQCGFKLFAGDLARRVFDRARLDGFAFDVEVLLLSRRMGRPVVEVPVAWRAIPGSRVRAVRDSLAMLIDVLEIWSSARRSTANDPAIAPDAAAQEVSIAGS